MSFVFLLFGGGAKGAVDCDGIVLLFGGGGLRGDRTKEDGGNVEGGRLLIDG